MSPSAVNHTQMSWSWGKNAQESWLVKTLWWEDGQVCFLCWCSMGQLRTPVILSCLIDSDIEASYKCFAKMIEMFFPSPLVIIYLPFKKHTTLNIEVQFRQADSQTGSSIRGSTVIWNMSLEQNMWISIPNTVWHLTMQSCSPVKTKFLLLMIWSPRTVKAKCVVLFNQ